MSSTGLCAVIFLCALTCAAAQGSCGGRCGGEYYRGSTCQCDYDCLSYGECCEDFESLCTTKKSCKGRCGESFRRGRLCSCDADCSKYRQCCSDHALHCGAQVAPVNESKEPSSFYDEDMNGQSFPNDEFTDYEEEEEPEESPESPGGPAADPLDPPTPHPATESPAAVDQNRPDEPEVTTPSETASTGPTETSSTGPTKTSTGPTETSTGPTETSSTGPTETSTGPTETSTGPTETSTGPTETSTGSTETSTGPTETSTGPTETSSTGPTETSTGPTETSSTGPTETSSTGPTETSTGPTETSSTGPTETSSTGPTETSSTGPTETSSTGPTETSTGPTETSSTGPTETSTGPPETSSTGPTETSTGPTETSSSGPTETSTGPTETSSTGPTETSSTGPTETSSSGPTETSTGPTETSSTGPTETSSSGPTETSSSGPTETSTGPTETSSTILASVLDPTGAPEGTTSSDEPARLDTTEEEVTHVTPEPTQPAPPRVQDQPDPYRPAPVRPSLVRPAPVRPAPVRPSSKPQTKPLGAGGYQADDSYDSDLCSGRPVGAVTTLRNGTMVVFRGHYFWLLDQHRVPGPARPITQAWGVPSPIDTAFTRCNCQGKTYIFKGSQYWRFENSVLDGNYPKVIQVGFGGLRGQITAALSVPQFQRRREAVYFFKRGGSVQKYSYQFGTSPTCGRKTQHAVYTRTARHAVSFLQPAVSIRTSWRGFPSSITAAASVPSASTADGYKYYVFSRSQSFSVRMDSGRPAVPKAKNNAAPRSRDFFKCSARA
ncbi:proteoglycan 4-like isoform X2 [Pseudoliparis swirei]|uniref:proteoglycan 4-like isoform X2 n=1 Tax=Pseudoliparis swirei TaxID=2059687 RepID=UPI0024BDA4A5|nr:proteoglycan 4-like isoform X2 [Pseudoliparis swirei]